MSALWTMADAVAATRGKSSGDWRASGVSIDTRTLKAGDLFVALRDQRDGHDFVLQALEKGAAAALVSRVPNGVRADAPLLLVPDVLGALNALARAARARTAASVIAVTGSVGKTSTKEMLRCALAHQGRVHAAFMSLNNHWGVPLTLARMPADTEFAVLEIGMNHAGEIAPLSRLARPHLAIVTNVEAVHMAAFASIAEIALAKAEIFAGLLPGGTAVLNRDMAVFDTLAARVHDGAVVSFGTSDQADFRLVSARANGGVTSVQAVLHGKPILFKISAPGRHLAMNALAVLAAVDAIGADPVIAALDLASWQPPPGRGARHWIALDPIEDEQRLELIDDAYNANPASMAAAFAVLADSQPVDGVGRIRKGRRVAFLTDMLELGPQQVALHRALADLPQLAAIDVIHSAGPLMHHLHHSLPLEKRGEWHDTAKSLAARVHQLLDAGDVVMVKGSKGSKASLVVDAIRKLGQANEK